MYHIWHGALEKRQYLKRIQDFTSTAKNITERDENGLHVTTNGDDKYVKEYFDHREDTIKNTSERTIIQYGKKGVGKSRSIKDIKREDFRKQYPDRDDSFIESLVIGYFTNSTLEGTLLGGDILGAAIGDALNSTDEFSGGEYGGGEFGGGGAGGTWEPNDNNDYTSENFS